MLLSSFLSSIGMSDKEIDIYRTVVERHKTTPAIVAEQLGRERTSTYKMMKNMVGSGFLSTTHEHGTTFFLAVDLAILQQRFETQRQSLNTIADSYDDILHEYESIQSAHQFRTSIRLLSGTSSIRYAYHTMSEIIAREGLRYITCIASHTLDMMSGGDPVLQELYSGFFSSLHDQKITVSSHLGQGLGLMERLQHALTLDAISEMPYANSATHVRIVGYDIFLLLFTADPQVIHIHSPQVAGLLMFVAEQLEKEGKS